MPFLTGPGVPAGSVVKATEKSCFKQLTQQNFSKIHSRNDRSHTKHNLFNKRNLLNKLVREADQFWSSAGTGVSAPS